MATCRLETAEIRYQVDGTAPTTTVGTLLEVGDVLTAQRPRFNHAVPGDSHRGIQWSPLMQLQPAVKKFLIGLSAVGAIALITMAQSPVTITPGTSQVYATAGSASAPSISFSGDPTSGWYDIAAGNTAFSSSGTGRLLITGATLQLKSDQTLAWSSGAINSASDLAFTRVAAGQYGITAVLFANLGTPASGTFCYCSDCTIANPCASGGSGAFAKRLNGVWVCN
jgi:hypothetical protein